jgi:hypothetical protein
LKVSLSTGQPGSGPAGETGTPLFTFIAVNLILDTALAAQHCQSSTTEDILNAFIASVPSIPIYACR